MPDDPRLNPEPLRPQSDPQKMSSPPPRISRPERPEASSEAPPPPPPPRGAGRDSGRVPPPPALGAGRDSGGVPAPPPPKPPADTTRGGQPRPGGSKNMLLSVLGVAVLAVVLVPRMFHSTPSLPEPAGQVFTMDYKSATLSVQPAPTTPMPPDHSTWN